jgi:hypothetical protein
MLKAKKLTRKKDIIEEGHIAASDLHLVLPVACTEVMTFNSKKRMQSYRRMLYTINRQGEFRYRSIRDEQSMWGIVIWRMA